MSLKKNLDRSFEELELSSWSTLQEICSTNLEHFNLFQDEASLKIKNALSLVLDTLDNLKPLYSEISKIAPFFDFDEFTPANGYRSVLTLVDKGILFTLSVCNELKNQKNAVLFRKNHHMKEIETCSQLLSSLCTCLQYAKILYSWRESVEDDQYSLFYTDSHSPQELLSQAKNINQCCFYGRCLGFQFCNSMKTILKAVLYGMTSFSEIYYANGTLLGRFTNSIQYLVDPEARARRVVTITQHADISFLQSFWSLNESNLVLSLPQLVMPSLAINQLISIPPEELEFETLDGSIIKIPIPNSHIGKKPIHVRLLSAKRRIGMVGSGSVKSALADQSDCLLVHCHGGGFVAQSSRSHESYLRTWTTELDVPIVSIDYSLAPQAPYPRAVEEVLYAYVWCLKHADTLLGSKAKKIIFAGDSAGANLNLVTAIRCLELNIRQPDGIFMAYSPVLLNLALSPARLLSLSDPILPFSFLMRCLKAYLVNDAAEGSELDLLTKMIELDNTDTESFAEVSESDLIALALSPTGDEDQNVHKLASLPSDSTLNSVSLTEGEPTQDATNTEEKKSQEYVKRFLAMYRNSKLRSSVPLLNTSKSGESSNGLSDTKTWSIFGWNMQNYKTPKHMDVDSSKNISDEFVFDVPKDPYSSPYLTSDALLQRLPPLKILTLELDPCLDDCVMFAKKLKISGNSVTLDVLTGLPHGFLNFSVFSKDAYEGSLMCVKRIRELIETVS